jgi:rod shape-determining protein MreD
MIPYYTRFFAIAFVLLILQILVFDHIDLFNYSNPAIYLIILITYRLDLDQFGFIAIGFFTGLFLDLLTQSPGAHSLAGVSIAFLRPAISRFALGANFNQSNALSESTLWSNRMLYIFLMIVVHQFIFSMIIYFNMTHLWTIIKHTLANTLFSFVLITATLTLFQRKT